MNKIITTIIFLLTLSSYCKAQDKVILTTGDTLVGNLYRIGEHRYRIIKPDGNSSIVADTLIASVISRDSVKVQNKPFVYNLPTNVSAGDYLSKASKYHSISFGMYAAGGLCYGFYVAQMAVKSPNFEQSKVPLYLGFGCGVIGFVFDQLAWQSIGDAGKKMNSTKVSLKVTLSRIGLCYRL